MLRLVGGDVSLASILDSRQVDDDQISKPALMRALEEIENQVNALLQTRQFVEIQVGHLISM